MTANCRKDKNPFLQLVINRAHATLDRLDKTIWQPATLSPKAEATDCLPDSVSLSEATKLPRKAISFPHYWGKLYQFRWFRFILPPANPNEPTRYLQWTEQSQATAWLNGSPFHGFDHYHRRTAVPSEGCEFWLESSCLPPLIGPSVHFDSAGSRCDGPALFYRDDDAYRSYYALQVLLDIAIEERMALFPKLGREIYRFGQQPNMDQASPFFRRLLRHLDQCSNAYDTGGLEALKSSLKDTYDFLRAKDGFAINAILTGHAHIDLVWMWPERIGEFKARHSFATVNKLLNSYPEFRFQYSQTASYRAVEKAAPQLMDSVRQHMASGKWEASGAMEVESDTLLSCGEALARSFALGQEGFTELTGTFSKLLWLPDVFGYSGCLPQLMKAYGVDYFFTTKLSWNAINAFPYSSFHWRGSDGSEVLAHLTQDIGYNNSTEIRELKQGELSYRQSDVHDEFLVPTGYGDGGGGPTPEMCERARNLAALSNMPRVRWDSPIAFFDRLSEVSDQLPVYEGELYFEYHRGTYTTHGNVKSAFRAAERSLQTVEAAHVVLGLGKVHRHWWERLVMAQFHDYIPGSSVPPVYRQALKELTRTREEALTEATRILKSDTSKNSCLFNPLPSPILINLEGGKLLTIPPLSGVSIDCQNALSTPNAVVNTANRLSNGHVEASVDSKGQLSELIVRGRRVRFDGPAAQIWIYEDHAAFFQAWDIDRQALDTGSILDTTTTICSNQEADGSGVISAARRINEQSSLKLSYRLRPGHETLECEIELDWQEPNKLLRIEFPTAYAGQMARYGSPFGSVLRPQKAGDPQAEAMWEVPGSRYAIALDDSGAEGFAIMTEAKYGFACRNGRLSLSLLRSPTQTGLGKDDWEFMYPAALRSEPEPHTHSDIGHHHIRFALGLFEVSAPRELQPASLAETLYAEPVSYQGAQVNSGLLSIEGDASLIPSWAQPLPNGKWLLRLHEVLGRHGQTRLKLDAGWRAGLSDFHGIADTELCSDELEFEFAPYKIVSVLMSPAIQ